MRIVGATPGTGNIGMTQGYRVLRSIGLIGVICAFATACATTRPVAPEREPAPAMAADDHALFERFQAEYALQTGDRMLAAEHLAKAAMLSDDPRQTLSALRAALYAGRQSAADALLGRWRQLEPEAPALPAYEVATALASGDSARAHIAADALGSGDEARRRLSEALRWIPAIERVMPFVEQRVDRDPDAATWLHWAGFARDRRAPETAQRLSDLAVLRFPNDARVYSFRAALVSERDPAAAAADLRKALALDATSIPVRMALAHALDASGDPAAAAAVLAAMSPPTDESVAAEIGYAARAENPQPLKDAYRHLESLPEPRSARRLMLLGNVAELVGEAAAAERWYGEVPDGEHRAGARLRLAALRFAAGDPERALELVLGLRQAGLLAREPLVRSYMLEAEIRAKHEGGDAAVTAYSAGLHMLPDDPELMYGRALTLADLGRYAEMERDLRRMIELDPADADALNALGYTLTDRNERLDEAAALLARAQQLTPDSPALLDSLGWLAYRKGDLDGALAKLRAAHKALDDPEVSAHLGEVLWQRGDREAARRVWDEATARDPAHRTLRATIRRFLP
jgi:Flp pilus assembly protein TadD